MNGIGALTSTLLDHLPLSTGITEWIAAMLVSPVQVAADLLTRASEIPVIGLVFLPLVLVVTIVRAVAAAVFFLVIGATTNLVYLWLVDRAGDVAALLHTLAAVRTALGWN